MYIYIYINIYAYRYIYIYRFMIYILACTLHLRGISPSSRVSCACDALRLILLFYVLNLWRLTVSSRLSIPSRCKWIHNATQCTLLYSGAGRPCRGAAWITEKYQGRWEICPIWWKHGEDNGNHNWWLGSWFPASSPPMHLFLPHHFAGIPQCSTVLWQNFLGSALPRTSGLTPLGANRSQSSDALEAPFLYKFGEIDV